MKTSLKALLVACAAAVSSAAFAAENLRIIGEDKSFEANLKDGKVTITRVMTPCGKNKGWLQPLVPAPGITPVTEVEVLNAMNDPDMILVDMRTLEWFVDETIPGAIHIPYTEVAMRLDELGCSKGKNGKFDCAKAKKVLGFCNGPVCPQSPSAMKAMIREGFPANKIYYYRGGMLDWDALGLTTVEGEM
ncbi:MAG: rhodanese-like domain-containing protein [Kangiellaceae bacterium]|jgi:rhodanese-related sulfurtransferase|nr:rhodanese-like domain-containing protein [Kangiellaceae bacterium]